MRHRHLTAAVTSCLVIAAAATARQGSAQSRAPYPDNYGADAKAPYPQNYGANAPSPYGQGYGRNAPASYGAGPAAAPQRYDPLADTYGAPPNAPAANGAATSRPAPPQYAPQPAPNAQARPALRPAPAARTFAGPNGLTRFSTNGVTAEPTAPPADNSLDARTREAVNQGFSGTMKDLGDRYNAAQNYAMAFGWYQAAASRGNVPAVGSLATLYLQGRGVAANLDEGVRLLKIGAGLGDSNAMYNLGIVNRDGMGVAKNDVEAVKWFQKAGASKHPSAAFFLGEAYRLGRGIEQSDAMARYWYEIASNYGYGPAAKAALTALADREGSRPGIPDTIVPAGFAKYAPDQAKAQEMIRISEKAILDTMEDRYGEQIIVGRPFEPRLYAAAAAPTEKYAWLKYQFRSAGLVMDGFAEVKIVNSKVSCLRFSSSRECIAPRPSLKESRAIIAQIKNKLPPLALPDDCIRSVRYEGSTASREFLGNESNGAPIYGRSSGGSPGYTEYTWTCPTMPMTFECRWGRYEPVLYKDQKIDYNFSEDAINASIAIGDCARTK